MLISMSFSLDELLLILPVLLTLHHPQPPSLFLQNAKAISTQFFFFGMELYRVKCANEMTWTDKKTKVRKGNGKRSILRSRATG